MTKMFCVIIYKRSATEPGKIEAKLKDISRSILLLEIECVLCVVKQ